MQAHPAVSAAPEPRSVEPWPSGSSSWAPVFAVTLLHTQGNRWRCQWPNSSFSAIFHQGYNQLWFRCSMNTSMMTSHLQQTFHWPVGTSVSHPERLALPAPISSLAVHVGSWHCFFPECNKHIHSLNFAHKKKLTALYGQKTNTMEAKDNWSSLVINNFQINLFLTVEQLFNRWKNT